MLKSNLPVLIIKDCILFPSCEIKLELNDIISKRVASLSENYFNNYLYVVYSDDLNLSLDNLPKIGVIAQIKLKLELPNGNIKLTLKGVSRGESCNYNNDDGIIDATVTNVSVPSISPVESLANSRTLKSLFIEYLDNKKSLGNSIVSKVDDENDLSTLTDIIASFMPLTKNRQISYIYETDSLKRTVMLVDDLHYELSLLEYENSLDDLVERNLEDNQKEFILREKLKIIQEQLGTEENSDIANLVSKISNLECPIYIKKKLEEELERYKLCNSNSPEIGIIRNYIDTLLSLPWEKSTKDNNDISNIKKILDESHYGMDEVKERIIEFIATKKYAKSKNNPIICLVGPPGIGKTSLAKAISKALKRKCVKISVGGINDEAEITGHRRAYVGALPGKIITGIKRAGVNNPVFIIDEIDKMTKDIKGDPASSLLEVLDKEQNDKFVDHFIEEEFDLSKVMFILTANYIEKIPNELKDRLEIIQLSSYNTIEKINIAKSCLIPKICDEYHLDINELKISDESLLKIIHSYTKESGVRELERIIRKLFRKYIYHKIENNIELDINNEIINFLGKEKYNVTNNYENDIGIINALSYHPMGGKLIKIESTYYEGNGEIISNGMLGDMMKESINLSMAYIKSNVKKFNLDFSIFKNNDFFINLTNGGIKKDGPSAGVCIVTSLLSLLKNKKVANNISMTGEISLSGRILPVGGIKEKLILASENKITKLFIPMENKNDIENLDEVYYRDIEIIYVNNYGDIYSNLFKK